MELCDVRFCCCFVGTGVRAGDGLSFLVSYILSVVIVVVLTLLFLHSFFLNTPLHRLQTSLHAKESRLETPP